MRLDQVEIEEKMAQKWYKLIKRAKVMWPSQAAVQLDQESRLRWSCERMSQMWEKDELSSSTRVLMSNHEDLALGIGAEVVL